MFETNELLKRLINYSFNNLYRKDKNVSAFLEEHFSEYIDDIREGLSGKNELLDKNLLDDLTNNCGKISNLSENIIETIQTFENGHIKQAYEKGYKLFDDNKDLFSIKEFDDQTMHCFARVRPDSVNINVKREMFHIPQNKSELIGAYRYSVAGYPCLYLASDLELSWYESNMPKKFSYCFMKVAENEKIQVINFIERPMEFLSGMITNLFNAKEKKEELIVSVIRNQIKNYILLYPLVASCSLIVKNRGEKYIPEYIMPQLLIQWIRENDDYDGVIYKSSLNCNLKDGMGAFNMALPVKEFRADGICEYLTRKLEVSDIYSIDTIKYFKEQKSQLIQQIGSFKNEIWLFLIHSKCNKEYLRQMVYICDYINLVYTALIENKYENSELVFNFINCLDSYIFMFKLNKENFINSMIITEGLEQEKTTSSEIEQIKKFYEDFLTITNKIVKKNQGFYLTHAIEKPGNYEKI